MQIARRSMARWTSDCDVHSSSKFCIPHRHEGFCVSHSSKRLSGMAYATMVSEIHFRRTSLSVVGCQGRYGCTSMLSTLREIVYLTAFVQDSHQCIVNLQLSGPFSIYQQHIIRSLSWARYVGHANKGQPIAIRANKKAFYVLIKD